MPGGSRDQELADCKTTDVSRRVQTRPDIGDVATLGVVRDSRATQDRAPSRAAMLELPLVIVCPRSSISHGSHGPGSDVCSDVGKPRSNWAYKSYERGLRMPNAVHFAGRSLPD